MSFGAGNTTKAGENNTLGASNLALNQQYPMVTQTGTNLMNLGGNTAAPGVDFFKSMLSGNGANTTAALQPSIDQIRQGNTATLNGINTLTPRGGGRYGALFGQSFAPQSQIQNLFNSARTSAATTLPQIGLQEEGLGTNLFGLGGQALSTGGGLGASLAGLGQTDTQMSRQLSAALGQGLFGLLTTPSGGGSSGGSSLLGKLLGLLAPAAGGAGSLANGGTSTFSPITDSSNYYPAGSWASGSPPTVQAPEQTPATSVDSSVTYDNPATAGTVYVDAQGRLRRR